MRTREQVYQYLIQPSPLFLKQVIEVAETKEYIVVQDLRKTKNMAIPDKVIQDYEYCFNIMKALACKAQEYEGVKYLILCNE
jgi:hypothetical protein